MEDPDHDLKIAAAARSGTIVYAAWDAYPLKKKVETSLDKAKKARIEEAKEESKKSAQTKGDRFSLSSIKLYGLWGEEQGETRTIRGPYDHWMFGGETSFRFLNRSVNDCVASVTQNKKGKCDPWAKKGTLSLYRSERSGGTNTQIDPDAPTRIPDGSGTVALLDLGFSWLDVKTKGKETEVKSRGSVRLLLGRGSGDDPATKNENEGYLGETASFAPDKVFLASLARSTSTSFLEEGEAMSGGQIGAGLSNKEYMGLILTNSRNSPLEWVAKWMNLESDVVAAKTVLGIHHYRFVEEVFGSKDAGREVSLEFGLEVPKGVSVSLGGAIFDPGEALDTVLRDQAWTLFSSVTVTLKP